MGGPWLSVLLAGVASTAAREPTQAQTDWTRRNAVVLQAVTPGHGFADLQPLKRLIGDARIVALGEPTHGSHEVFQLKHRLLEFLVEELGVSILAIEAGLPESFRVNDYVMRGEGDPRRLISGLQMWPWTTEEVYEMVAWMRRHNAEADGRRRGPRLRVTGFDVQKPELAAQIVSRFVEQADTAYAPAVRDAARAASVAEAEGPEFGVGRSFPAEVARGRTLSYRGWIKTEDLQDGYAGLSWRCYYGRAAEADDMRDRGPRGTTGWQRFEVTMTVPAETSAIAFGVLMSGRGKAWFDGLEITLDGKPWRDPSFDLDFESARLEGWKRANGPYEVKLDQTVAKTGRQSLRIEGRPTASWGAKDPARVAETWRSVVSHLEQSRGRYHDERDLVGLDWAIVNARLVSDAMDIRSGKERSARDRAMARMVAWIREQSPQARVVLWAHNLHVQRQPGSMGRFLEEMFPGQMVTLGFATGEGTYQAASVAGTGITSWGLVHPPPDSFESVFQRTGLPLFVLDLRNAVAGSADSGFLLELRPFRAIGSMASEKQFFPQRLRDSFDGVVWIEKTSAAEPLAR